MKQSSQKSFFGGDFSKVYYKMDYTNMYKGYPKGFRLGTDNEQVIGGLNQF